MNRNGLVFVPREPPKRVILYPAQNAVHLQQQSLPNRFYLRAKTDLLSDKFNGTIQQSSNYTRLSRAQPLSSLLNHADRTDSDGTIASVSGHSTVKSAAAAAVGGQKAQNPYYANPFFRPKIITNQPSTTVNLPTPSLDLLTTVTANKGRQPIYPNIQSPFLLSNSKALDSESTVITSLAPDDSRHWTDSATLIPTTTNNEPVKQKDSSTTDIVISLMDPSRTSINSESKLPINHPTRNSGITDESTVVNQTVSASEHLLTTPPYSLIDVSSTTSQNNQNWKKTLAANFQKNYRNISSAKLLHAKQSLQSSNNDTTTDHSFKSNEIDNENTSAQQSSESLIVPKQDSTYIERLTSLQIQKTNYSSDQISHKSMSIPSALLSTKPPVNIEQQRANITRVMIRRDFVKSTDSKPPMPTASNMRAIITSQSAKADGFPGNNIIRVATISDNPNRSYPIQQQTGLLSQKSLISFPAVKESHQQKLNEINSSQTATTNGGSRREYEEINTKTIRRAASGSATSYYE